MNISKPIIVVSLHIAPLFLGAWASHLWDHGHEGIGLFACIVAGLTAFGALMRDLYLDEIAEALSPTHVYHGSQVIEPPKPLPAFDDQPSRVRIKALVDSVAPADADPESTWPEVG